MKKENACAELDNVIREIGFPGPVLSCKAFGNGHINDTFSVYCRQADGSTSRYVLQRINHEIFKNPMQVMENVTRITTFLKDKIERGGGDPSRETLSFLPMPGGNYCYRDSIGSYWRSYRFIENAVSFDQVERSEDFYQSAVAFGRFQFLLSDFDAGNLHETIKNFHNTPVRYQAFLDAVKRDPLGRAASVREEIEFVRKREKDMGAITTLLNKKEIPLRVTHNDTKLNNVLFDEKSRRAICVIDLDTVMPGTVLIDFGDSIRFGASTGEEDEPDLSKIWFDLALFETYTRGYLKGCSNSLTPTEVEMMPMGAKLMTLECGMRFLTDYLEGDTYFKIQREGHNLDRCRTQFKLVADMEGKWDRMRGLIREIEQEK